MAFFKFRKGSDATPAAAAQPESVEALRRRARHRLIGAAVLVLVGVIGFPLLFDTQPRPIAVDIPIEIPDRTKAKPLPAPPQSRVQGAVTQEGPARMAAAAPASAPAKAASSAVARDAAPAAEAATPAPTQQAKSDSAANAVPEAVKPTKVVPEAVKPTKAAEAGRTQSPPAGKPTKAQEADGRFVVQVGAFSDAGKARETRLRVEKAGLKTYTNVAETRDGKRIRVRVGPFASRAEADKAAGRIKELDLPASILAL